MENALKVDYNKPDYEILEHKKTDDKMNEIEYIKIDQIRPNPYQPRKNFNKAALMELSESIKAYGVLQPINVRKQSGGYYELVAGERRLRASQLAGLKRIPCIVVSLNDNDSAIIALIENLQREDLNFIEEAEGYTSLIYDHGLTQEELARKIGKSQSTVANKVRLLRLSPLVRKILIDNNLTERHARALLKVEDEELQVKILKEVCNGKLNVKKTEEFIEKAISGDEEIFKKLHNEISNDKTNNDASHDSEKTEKRPQIKRVIKDLRIFVNTIKESVEMLKDSGVSAKAAQFDRGEYLEFIIRIPKKENYL